MSKNTINPIALTSGIIGNTKALRTSLEKYVHFVPISLGVIAKLLDNITDDEKEIRNVYNIVYSKLSSTYPISNSISIDKISTIITNSSIQRLAGKPAIGVYSNNTLIGILTSNYANASSLVVKVIQNIIGVDLAVGHVVGDIELVTSKTLGGHVWLKNNLTFRSPASMKLALIQELFALAEHLKDKEYDTIIDWYFLKSEGSPYYSPKKNFLTFKDAISAAGKVFVSDLSKISSETDTISKTKIVSGITTFYNKYFKVIHSNLSKYGIEISSTEVNSAVATAINRLATEHQKYFNEVIDTATITKEFTATLQKLKIVFVLPQTRQFNSKELAPIEQAIAKECLKFDALNFKSSPSIKEYILDTIEELVINGTDKKPFKQKTKAVSGSIGNINLITKPNSISKVQQKVSKRKKTTKVPLRSLSGQFTSITNIESLIRLSLQDIIIKNMQRPNLENQTGRFARSVELKSISQKGQALQVFLTYMKYPYQTFEPGFAQGFRGYDPKRLIDLSVREIATKLVKARLQTVFV